MIAAKVVLQIIGWIALLVSIALAIGILNSPTIRSWWAIVFFGGGVMTWAAYAGFARIIDCLEIIARASDPEAYYYGESESTRQPSEPPQG